MLVPITVDPQGATVTVDLAVVGSDEPVVVYTDSAGETQVELPKELSAITELFVERISHRYELTMTLNGAEVHAERFRVVHGRHVTLELEDIAVGPASTAFGGGGVTVADSYPPGATLSGGMYAPDTVTSGSMIVRYTGLVPVNSGTATELGTFDVAITAAAFLNYNTAQALVNAAFLEAFGYDDGMALEVLQANLGVDDGQLTFTAVGQLENQAATIEYVSDTLDAGELDINKGVYLNQEGAAPIIPEDANEEAQLFSYDGELFVYSNEGWMNLSFGVASASALNVIAGDNTDVRSRIDLIPEFRSVNIQTENSGASRSASVEVRATDSGLPYVSVTTNGPASQGYLYLMTGTGDPLVDPFLGGSDGDVSFATMYVQWADDYSTASLWFLTGPNTDDWVKIAGPS